MSCRCLRYLIPCAFVFTLRGQTPPTAAEIMARAASNMERGTEARKLYLYEQALRMKMIPSDGKVARQEDREYEVLPTPTGTQKTLVRFAGSYRQGPNLISYQEAKFRRGKLDLDGELMDSLIESLVDDKESRDGVLLDLFPLRSAQIPYYRFTLRENVEVAGRAVYRIDFQPDWKKCKSGSGNCPDWEGEALIDRQEFFPVRIDTHLAHAVPWVVRTALGSNVRQAGFSITYTRLDDGIWFPTSYGTEFRLKLFWSYRRTITLSLDNRRFRKTSADSKIVFEP